MVEKNQCLTLAVVEDITNQCAVLRITHPLPTVRTYSKVKAPTLIYYYDQAGDATYIPVNIARTTASPPQYVRTTLYRRNPDNTLTSLYQRVDGGSYWAGTGAQRLVMIWPGLATGPSRILPYQIRVEFQNAGQWTEVGAANGQAAIVRRDLAIGWHVAGVEELYPGQYDGSILWVGGDGSTRRYMYRTDSAGYQVYSAPAIDRPDDLIRRPSDGQYYRLLPGQRMLMFDSYGRHRQSYNQLSQVVYFDYVGATRKLSQITVGPLSQSLRYQFYYSSVDGGLDSIVAPNATTGVRRVTRITRVGAVIKSIKDPDNRAVSFEHQGWGTFGQINARTDRRGTRVALEQEPWSPTLYSAEYNDGRNTVHHQFHSDRYPGADPNATPVAVSGIYFFYNGPRVDGEAGVDGIWVRNNRFGAPEWIQNAYGHVTTIEHGNTNFPGLATAVTTPTATGSLRTEALYNSIGLPTSISTINPYGDGSVATTTYQWDAKWRLPTYIASPAGVITEAAYNATTGTKLWEQTGGSGYRVSFSYYDATAGAANGMLSSWKYPGRYRVGQLFDSLAYDALGNVTRTRSAENALSEFQQDLAGRTVRVSSVIKLTDTTLRRVDSTAYDAMDRVLFQRSSAPAMNGAPAEMVSVVTGYTPTGGDVASVSRTSSPDNGGIGTLTTTWVYDRGGRVVKEIAPGGGVDSTTYDAAGNAIVRRNGNQKEVTMTYDALNRLASRILQPVTSVPQSGGIASLPGISNNPAYQASIPGDTEIFEYDVAGNLIRADNFAAQIRRGYYPNGQLRRDTLRIRRYTDLASGDNFAQHQYITSYRYDGDGRRIAMGYPQQLAPVSGVVRDTVRYSYTAGNGHLASISDLLPQSYTFGYNLEHRLTSIVRPGGISETLGYTDEGQLASETITNGSTSAYKYPDAQLRNVTLTYDARAQLTQITNTAGLKDSRTSTLSGLGNLLTAQYSASGKNNVGNAVVVSNTETFTNDALSHLLTTQESSNGVIRSGFGAGSRYSSSQAPRTYSHQANTGRLRTINHFQRRDTLEYDAAGNRRFSHTVYAYFSPYEDFAREPREDWAFFYAADGTLRQTDYRWLREARLDPSNPFRRRVVEEYRYDALGRRVLTRTRRSCEGQGGSEYPNPICRLSTIRRTVWDGDRELGEIQMPGYDVDVTSSSSALAENDVNHVQRADEFQSITFNSSNQFGRVAYTYGSGVDQPLTITRMGYSDVKWANNRNNYCAWSEPVAIQPLWHPRGVADIGVFADGGTRLFRTLCSYTREFAVGWKYGALAYNAQVDTLTAWQGTLLEGKLDGAGLQYRRNRYYDPATGRFTQPDPIGLAGGLNAYGFAAGDPITYSDPFGFCPLVPGTSFFTVSDCPPGHFEIWGTVIGTAIGYDVGGTLGGAGGAAAGEVVCAGVPVCGVAAGVAGARVGSGVGAAAGATAGAGIGRAIDTHVAKMANAGKGRGGNQVPNKQIEELYRRYGLNHRGQSWVHRKISKKGMEIEEIEEVVQEAAGYKKFLNNPES